MSNVLIVEDEIFVAIEVQSVLMEMGHRPVGIAADSRRAMELAAEAEIALVDLNLHDGPTGTDVGRELAARGVTVVFITANPSQLGDGVPGALGVLPKPVNDNELQAAINFVAAIHRREHPLEVRPPRRLRLFQLPAADELAARPTG
jgi:DNA-binding response OmpR family regulator